MKYCVFLCVLFLFSVSGCRNHMRELDINVTDYERRILRNRPSLQVIEADENNGIFRFKLTGNRESEIKEYQVLKTISRYTPWNGWREYYEVPLGLLLFPFGVAGHAVNIITLGMYPFNWCTAVDSLSLSALNPGLNIEDPDRFEDEVLHSRKTLIDTRIENTVYPLRDIRLNIRLGHFVRTVKTDSDGFAVFELLSSDGDSLALNTQEREFRIFVPGVSTPVYSQIITRDTRERLRRAAAAIKKYRRQPDGKKLYRTVMLLEKLKFSKLSHCLEKQELNKNGKHFQRAFYREAAAK